MSIVRRLILATATSCHGPGPEVLTVSPGSRAPASFFAIHRFIRTLQQRVRIGPVFGVARETHAGPNPQDRALPQDRLSNGCGYLLNRGAESRGGAGLAEQNYELITSKTGDRIRLAHHALQPLSGGDQHGITGFVAQSIVDC